MKAALVALMAALAAATSAVAQCPADTYQNVSGHCVHRPEHANRPPEGATAQCRDGTYSFSEHHSGTCSHHGGVARWL
jgi:hypothetical protein